MFADVILPLPLSGTTFTYTVPSEMQSAIAVGFRVIIPFGTQKFYTAIVRQVHEKAPDGFEAKEIHSLVDSVPIVTETQLSLWEWISFYYMSPLGDVYNAALPSMLKLEGDATVSMNTVFTDWQSLSETEKLITDAFLKTSSIKLSEIAKQSKIKNVLPHIHSLVQKNAIEIEGKIEDKYTPKIENFIRINPNIDKALVPSLIGNAAKQRQLFEKIEIIFSEEKEISRKQLISQTSTSVAVLNGLIQKNILEQFSLEISRIDSDSDSVRTPFPLNSAQETALLSVKEIFEQKQVCLLHGVTASGKTEIYIHLISEYIEKRLQTLYLVPEIALTTQLVQRLKNVFGVKLGIYHSKISDSERAEIWKKMLSDEPYEIVIGARSAIFLPYTRLGLVIVDEEHETGYKQQEPSPRYHARDTAIVLAQLSGAKTLLGSATPSFESYFNTQIGKYGLVTLSTRFEEIELPEIRLENTRELRRKKKMKSALTPSLIEQIHSALQNNEQVILFRNRRGFAPMLECKSCAWTPKCRRCDVPLTYHKSRNELKCHYCNATYKIPTECPVCHEKQISLLGQGTEHIEEDVKNIFPDASIARMDGDTTHGKKSYAQIISAFEEGKVQILIGTQMLSKGLDFENVSVVGILSADSLLNHPDFRSYERGFQMMLQASGRAGRKNKRGIVVMQSSDPSLPIYRFVEKNDYRGFFLTQMQERKDFRYPPYFRLISIVLKHKNEAVVDNAAKTIADLLRQSLSERVLGPAKPVIGRIQSYYIREILLKLETGLSPQNVREFILQSEQQMRSSASYKYVQVIYNVDPL